MLFGSNFPQIFQRYTLISGNSNMNTKCDFSLLHRMKICNLAKVKLCKKDPVLLTLISFNGGMNYAVYFFKHKNSPIEISRIGLTKSFLLFSFNRYISYNFVQLV